MDSQMHLFQYCMDHTPSYTCVKLSFAYCRSALGNYLITNFSGDVNVQTIDHLFLSNSEMSKVTDKKELFTFVYLMCLKLVKVTLNVLMK